MGKKESILHSSLRTVEWKDNKVVMIDQTKLPNQLVYVEFSDYNQVADAIRNLVVRGAPAIGVSGAFGLALAALQSNASTKENLLEDLGKARKILFDTRPTAVNLGWGLERIMKVANSGDSVEQIKELGNEKVVLLGRQFVSFNKEKFKKLTSLPNVQYLGEKPYHELLKYVAHFDVGIIPRISSAFTKAINPKKFYEYLACGKPVVATMMPELERYEKKGILARAPDVDSFVVSLKQMIDCSNDLKLKKKRLELAKENSWQKRYEKINYLIQEKFKEKIK